MSIDQQFDSLNVSAIEASDIMATLEMSNHEIDDPVRFQRFKDIIDYVKTVPDKRFFINKAIAGKSVDKLNHLWGYVELNKRKDAKRKELAKLDEEISFYE